MVLGTRPAEARQRVSGAMIMRLGNVNAPAWSGWKSGSDIGGLVWESWRSYAGLLKVKENRLGGRSGGDFDFPRLFKRDRITCDQLDAVYADRSFGDVEPQAALGC